MSTQRVVDGCARVVAGIDSGRVYASGLTQDVTDAEPAVVPLAIDFLETAGEAAVTVALGPWTPTLQPGNEREHLELRGAIWVASVPLDTAMNRLYAYRDALKDQWIAHTKAWLVEASLQSAVLRGGPGIVPRTVPRAEGAARAFLTLPFTVDVVTARAVVPVPN